MTSESSFIISPGSQLSGDVRVAGDKSISHRSIMFAAIADGVTRVNGFLDGEDCLATIKAFRAMGVQIDGPTNGEVTIHGVGINGLREPVAPMDVGNSGTSMRLMIGLLAGQSFDSELVGDDSLMTRPMRRVTDPLQTMGAVIETTDAGTAPIKITGRSRLRGIDYDLPMASAQVKSAVLLAGLYAEGKTCTREPAPTRDHTERMLAGFGYAVERSAGDHYSDRACVEGGGSLTGREIDVPADISSAAFFMVGASIAPGSDITLKHVGMNPTRTGVIDILRLMGADLSIDNEREVGGEPVADIRVRYAKLKGIVIPEALVPLAIDEFPAVFVAAACAEGETVLTGAEELRVKESDRIAVMADGLKILGIQAEPTADGIVIQGSDGFASGEVETHGDHRIAMSFAMAGLRASGNITIRNCANVNTSFPGFAELAAKSGLDIQVD